MAVFVVNGQEIRTEYASDTPLLWFLRDQLDLTGTKYGCGVSACGACTVHIDGVPTRSCSTPLSAIPSAADVTTIEGVKGAAARALQAAWVKHDVVQCGYCQSGQIMSATALLAKNPRPSDADIDAAMSGNICRCATYQRIRAAVKDAATQMAAAAPVQRTITPVAPPPKPAAPATPKKRA
jgi:isoquinoline 1-oxidoreductase subunit alpha